jgi:hypothetical protein
MLYLIKSGEYFKIGFSSSSNLKRRIDAYLTCNPNFELLGIREGTRGEESKYHKCLKFLGLQHPERMEWFREKGEILSILKEQFILDYKTLYPELKVSLKPYEGRLTTKKEINDSIKEIIRNKLNLTNGFYPRATLKVLLSQIYKDVGLKSTPKATDIQLYYNARPTQRIVNNKSTMGFAIE